MKLRTVFMTLIVFCSLLPSLAVAAITTDPAMPTQYAPVNVRVVDSNGMGVSDVALTAEYYPSTELTRRKPACTTDANGECLWMPDTAGLVRLVTAHENHVVSVRYEKVPISAIVVFLVAAFTLIGTLSFGVYRLNQSSRAD